MGLFDALNVAARGLNAAQVSIDVTGQNISNANTEGYSRKRVQQEAGAVAADIFGQRGVGVEITSVNRIRDEFLDRQIWEHMGEMGYTKEIDTAYVRLESILREPTDTGLAAQLNKFWASWQDLANNPANLSAREAVMASANVLTDTIQTVYKQVDDYGLSMNNPLANDVKTVNDITTQIFQLNEKIASLEGNVNQNANDTKDQRDLQVRKLAEYIDVQTINDDHGRVIVSSGGSLLVGPSESMKLGVYGIDVALDDGTLSAGLGIKFLNSGRAFVPRSGSLKGIMEANNTVLNGYKNQLNDLAKSMVEEVNSEHTLNYTLNKTSGVNFFDPTKTSAGNIKVSDTVRMDSKNIAAAKGGVKNSVATFQPPGGIPAALTPTLDLKTINPAYKDLSQGDVKLTLASGVVLEEGAGKDYIVEYGAGKITFLNYAKYNPADVIDVKISYDSSGFPGNGNGEGAGTIAKIRFAKTMSDDINGVPTQSISEYYSALIGKMGIERNQNSAKKDTKEFLIQQMDSEQSTIAGVSLDEEMTNMIKFENSYKASAKYMQTITAMMDVLMAIQ